MRLDELHSALRARPFKPIRLFLTDGGSYEVAHPDLCLLLRRTAIIGFPAATAEGDEGDRYAVLDLNHVSRMEASGETPASLTRDKPEGPLTD